MSEDCPTVRIKDDNAPGGYVVINESDYDPAKHTLYIEKATVPKKSGAKVSDAAEMSSGNNQAK